MLRRLVRNEEEFAVKKAGAEKEKLLTSDVARSSDLKDDDTALKPQAMRRKHAPHESGESRRVLAADGGVRGLQLSPDGTTLVFVVRVSRCVGPF